MLVSNILNRSRHMSDLDPKDYYKHTNVFKVTALDTHLERSAAKDMEAEDKPLSSLKAYDPNDPERKRKRIRDEFDIIHELDSEDK